MILPERHFSPRRRVPQGMNQTQLRRMGRVGRSELERDRTGVRQRPTQTSDRGRRSDLAPAATQRSTRPDEPDDRDRPAPWERRPTGARPVHCAASGPVGRCCTFDRDPLSEDPRDYAETPRRSTTLKSSHVQAGPLCTWERITVTATIRENPGITRKTRRRPARVLLSHVQYPRDRPEQTSRAALPPGPHNTPATGPRRTRPAQWEHHPRS